MSARRNPSFAWALHLDVANIRPEQLTDAAYQGLEYAQELAENGKQRSQDPRDDHRPARLTVDDLADREGLAAATVRRLANRARRELFGPLSDDGIVKRTQRSTQQGPRRVCSHPGCTEPIAANAHGNRRYCENHRTGKARTARSRTKNNPTNELISRSPGGNGPGVFGPIAIGPKGVGGFGLASYVAEPVVPGAWLSKMQRILS